MSEWFGLLIIILLMVIVIWEWQRNQFVLSWVGNIEDETIFLSTQWGELKERLMLFAQGNSGGEEKTEKPSPKKLQDARKKGQIPKSNDVNTFGMLLVVLMLGVTLGPWIVQQFQAIMVHYLAESYNRQLVENPYQIGKEVIQGLLPLLSVSFGILLGAGVIVNMMQVGFVFSMESLKPNWNQLNPINGFKEMFSQKKWFELAKNLVKLILMMWVSVNYFKSHLTELLVLSDMSLGDSLITIGRFLQGLLMQVILWVGVIAAIDYGYQRFDFMKGLRMTKQEMKEEYKQMEGDPFIKGKRRQKQREISMNRMMSAIADATVIVTNPTHFAIAIRYEHEKDMVPVVVAKGIDFQALRIKEKAKEHQIPIIENKPLARTLYKQVEIDQEIPFELYQAVAELLALVMKLNRQQNYR